MTDRFKIPHRFGVGGVPIGNQFSVTTDAQAHDTLSAAWDAGVRYFDVAPFYGLGLSERRYGQFLRNKPRDSFVLSSKVGRLLKAGAEHIDQQIMPLSGSPNTVVYDYTYDGTMRSIEDTLQRTGLPYIDVAFVHDLSPDNTDLPEDWTTLWPTAVDGCFRALGDLRAQGVIKAWGMGVNRPEPILKSIEDADPDLHLMASQYSLIDHHHAVEHVLPAVRKAGNGLVIGSVLANGFLAGKGQYLYGDNNNIVDRAHMKTRDRMRDIAFAHGIDLMTAAILFGLAPDVCDAVAIGCGRPDEAIDDFIATRQMVAQGFWDDLRSEGLIHPDAPVPQGA